MKVQRLIEKYKKLEGVWDAEGAELARQIFLQDLEQLDEPEKVTIPKFVADWIEECKAKEKRLLTALLYTPEKVNSWVDNSENQELFAQAWIFGYEVEEEKRYLVKMKNILDRESFLNLSNTTKIWFFGDKKDTEYVYVHHTRKELEEAGFGWVFDCPGVQIGEVE